MEVTSFKDTTSNLKRDLERVRGQFDEQDDELNNLIHQTRRGDPLPPRWHSSKVELHPLARAQFASLNSLPGIKGIANELGDEEEVSCSFVQGCRGKGGPMQITLQKKKFPHSKCVELVQKA